MGKVAVFKINNNLSNKYIIEKLKIEDYVFCYKGNDLSNGIIKYSFGKNNYAIYDNGQKKSNDYSHTISFSISADDINEKTCSFDFIINMDLDTLNKFTNQITNINNYIIQSEVFFFDANKNSQVPEFMDFDLEESIYYFHPTFLVQKINNNLFVFKIQYMDLFIWFKIDFNYIKKNKMIIEI